MQYPLDAVNHSITTNYRNNLDPYLIRRDFPIFSSQQGKRIIYLDNAATTQRPFGVIRAIEEFYSKFNANVHRGAYELSSIATEKFESARRTVASFINASSPNEIIFTRNATEGINLVAWSWGLSNLKTGDVILLTELEHHSNLVPWQLLAKYTGAKLAFVPITGPTGIIDTRCLKGMLKDPVRIFAFTHVSNSLGVINPIEEWCSLARKQGIITVVDAAQSAGHMVIDVKQIGCDFLVFSAHKMCGPTGIGVLYGKEELLEAMPPYQAGGEMIEEVSYYESSWASIPHKFEAGTPHIAGAIGLHAAIDYIKNIGRDRIMQHDLNLAAYALDRLKSVPTIKIFGPPEGEFRAGIVSFILEHIHPHDLVTFVDRRFGITLRGGHHCTQPLMRKLGLNATARASFYFYNSYEEIDILVEALKEAVKFFL